MLWNLTHLMLHVLSGDTEKDKGLLRSIFPSNTIIIFHQSPKDKLEYIEKLINQNKKVMMFEDGLNDAGALGKSEIGIAVSEDIFRFTPSSDAIIESFKLQLLPIFISI